MQRKYFNNFITSILVLSFILTPFGIVSIARAQSISGYISGVAPMIAKLPQCQTVIDNKIKHLFGKASVADIAESNAAQARDSVENALNGEDASIPKTSTTILNDKVTSAGTTFDSVKVNISGSAESKAILETNTNVKKTLTASESMNANSTCIQSIGRLIIKMLLQKLTVSTVAWINSGFDGSPAFIQDSSKFFGDIAKNEILQFGIEINDPTLFPFGADWMKNTAVAFNNKFQDNARYSLDELIKNTNPEYSATTFQQDFGMGGWEAWTALTQVPANNPLGFKLMADNEIQARLAGTAQSTAQNVRDALQEANGFLGDQRCVDPKGITKQQDYEAKVAVPPKTENICKKWEYVTPGKMISDKATEVMGYQNNAYLNVEDLNDAVAAILDALLGQFSANIMEKGFANMSNDGADGTLVYSSSGLGDPYRSQTEKDFNPTHLSSSWLSSNPEFNIRTDLNQALIDEQRTYIDKLKLQNKELLSTTDGNKYKLPEDGSASNAYGLMPVIWQLDYCIPGPHPGWEEDSARVLSAGLEAVLPETQETLKDKGFEEIMNMAGNLLPSIGGMIGGIAIGAQVAGALGSIGLTIGTAAFPVVGTIAGLIIGTAAGWVIKAFSGDNNKSVKVRAYYAKVFHNFTYTRPDVNDDNDVHSLNLESKSGVTNILNTTLNRYAEIIHKIYFSDPEILPTVSQEAALKFNQIDGYAQMIINNEEKIASLQIVINTLNEIKEKVNILNATYPDGGDVYDNELKDQINAFGRLSSSMVNGDDIADADNLLKQIIDEKNYIYNNLLKGPYGCEKDLMKTQKRFATPGTSTNPVMQRSFDWNRFDVNSVLRMTYPSPILYDYNKIEIGKTIPNPWEICSPKIPNKICQYGNNTIPSPNSDTPMYNNTRSIFGPGFLSFVFFSSGNSNAKGAETLFISDLVRQNDDAEFRFVSVGDRIIRQTEDGVQKKGVFETMIGIY